MIEDVPAAPEINRIVLLEHPSYKRAADQCEEKLRATVVGDIVRFQTCPDAESAAELLLSDKIEDNDLLALVAGDGSRLQFGEAIMGIKASDPNPLYPGWQRRRAESLLITSLGGGNARDGGSSEHGRAHRYFGSPVSVIRSGVRREAYGMQFSGTARTERGSKPISGYALSCIGIGKTGLIAAELAQPRYSDSRKVLRDLPLVARHLNSKFKFHVLIDDAEWAISASDLSFYKGRYAARYTTLPNELWEPRILTVKTPASRFGNYLSAARYITGLVRPRYRDSSYIVPASDVRMHRDGQPPLWLQGEQPFEVSLAKETYGILTLRGRQQELDMFDRELPAI